MTDRLSATDASFLYAEDAGTPMHVGGVAILQPDPAGPEFEYSTIVDLIESRLSLVPRYRQKVRFVPGEPMNASLAVSRGDIFIRTDKQLWCISKK